MIVRVAVCDHNEKARDMVIEYVSQYFDEKKQYQCIMKSYQDSTTLLEDSKKTNFIDILIINTHMPGVMGVEACREIRTRNRRVAIIFLSDSGEYAVQAFEVHATHYILNPPSKNQLAEALDHALGLYPVKNSKMVSFTGRRGEVGRIDIDQIVYIETFGHFLYIHTDNGEKQIDCRKSLAKFSEELEILSKNQFVTPFRGYLVNQFYIQSITLKGMLLKDGTMIPIVKRNFRIQREKYMEYIQSREGSGELAGS